MKYAIRYRYPGTENGTPVGVVFALDAGDIAPGVWSYAKDPREATLFDTAEDAERTLAQHHYWPEAQVVEVAP
jgi:hypothetical protein